MPRSFEILPCASVIRETYTIEGVIGEGAFGVVYKVRHKFLGMQALKVFHPEKVPCQSQDNLLAEAFILSKITHPNVVRVFDANYFNRHGQRISYVAMEYVPGGTLNAYLLKHGKLPHALALQLQIMICRGLAQAHTLNPPVIHRDVKPQNIMVDREGDDIVLKVSDFGQAKLVDPLTKIADSAGTLAYMAPEGFWNYKSPASDVFSAGIIFYMMLTGVSPFKIPPTNRYKDEKEVERIIRKSRAIPPAKVSDLCQNLDGRWDQIIMKSLERDSSHRYANASEFLHDLETVVLKEEAPDDLKIRIDSVLAMGKQYRDLPKAIAAMETIFAEASKPQRQELMRRYGKILASWRKGIIL